MRDMGKVIGKLAYELWEQAGRPDGRSDEFWLTARFESQRREETGGLCHRNGSASRVGG